MKLLDMGSDFKLEKLAEIASKCGAELAISSQDGERRVRFGSGKKERTLG
jgi:hypothetical protein